MKTALVTGCSGFVGRYLTDALRDNGWEVYGFDLANGGDIRDYEQIRAGIDTIQPDAIWHLAAQAYVAESTRDPHRAMAVNTTGTLNLLEAVRNTGSHARIVIAGTSEEYGYEEQPGPTVTEDSPTRPNTPYGVSKLAATSLARVYTRTHGLQIIVTRAFNHTGPGQPAVYAVPAFARRVAEAEAGHRDEVVHGNLDATRNYTDVRDIVAAYQLALDAPPGIYNLCSPHTVSMKWVLDTLVAHANRPIRTRLDESLYRPSGSQTFYPPTAAKFHEATGWEPTIPLERTLAEVLDHWRQQL
jgi:GDP-4-dehydro-6-deoxy-D-mannose reductase